MLNVLVGVLDLGEVVDARVAGHLALVGGAAFQVVVAGVLRDVVLF